MNKVNKGDLIGKILSLLFLLCTLTEVRAQVIPSLDSSTFRNVIYAELGGRFLLGGGVQYERALALTKSCSLLLGVGVGSSSRLDRAFANWPIIVPISGALSLGRRRGRWEVGFSRLLVKKAFYEDPNDEIYGILPMAGYLGYRQLPSPTRRLFFKIDLLVYPSAFYPLPFLGGGVGYAF
ncbi:MAG: hypothetical protein AAF632_15620 [Bacteroidota bacterium]